MRRLRALVYQVVPTLVLFGLAAYTVWGEHGYVEWTHRAREAEAARAHLAELDGENDRLMLRVRELQDDPIVLERLVADELGLVRPGGRLYVFADDATGAPGTKPAW